MRLPHSKLQFIKRNSIFDFEQAIDVLIQNDGGERIVFGSGAQLYIALDSGHENLLLYDDGEVFEKGTTEDAQGASLHYNLDSTGDAYILENLNYIADVYFQYKGAPSTPIDGFGSNADFRSKHDLDFASYERIEEEAESILSGLVDFEEYFLEETYSLDLQNLEDHYQRYLSYLAVIEGETRQVPEMDLSKDDETYIFLYQQLIEDMPLMRYGNPFLSGAGEGAIGGNQFPLGNITLAYTKDGLISLVAQQLYTVTASEEPSELIPLTEAFEVLLANVEETIISREQTLVSARLLYLSYPLAQEDGLYELRPSWIFTTQRADTIDGVEFFTYRYDAVDAVTSELILGRWS